jgi:hypothetical protein
MGKQTLVWVGRARNSGSTKPCLASIWLHIGIPSCDSIAGGHGGTTDRGIHVRFIEAEKSGRPGGDSSIGIIGPAAGEVRAIAVKHRDLFLHMY